MSESTEANTQQQANQQIARAAGVIFLAMLFGQIVGQAAKIATVARFGTSDVLDAYNAANRVSETIYLLVAGGALGSSFIPVFTGLLTESKRKEAWKLASSVINLVTLILIGLSLLVMIFADFLVVQVLAPGFSPEQQALTAQLLRILMPTAIIFGVSGLCMGILNSYQKFLLPALAPSLYQVGIIIGVVFLAPVMGIQGLAWGTLIGAGLHFVIQLPQVLRLSEQKYQLLLGIGNSKVREVIFLMLPRLLGVAVVQLNFWVNTIIASSMAEGSLTAILIGFALMLMPQTVIAQAMATAALPTFSAQFAQGKIAEMRSSLASTLRAVLILAIPAAVGMILLRRPIIAMFYQYGAADAASTELIAWALLWYTVGLISHCVYEILARAFYALHDTRTPVLVGVVAMSLNVVLSLGFAALFSRWGWMPHGGLALANSLATTIEMVSLTYFMARRLKGLELPFVFKGVLKSLIAAGVMGGVLSAWLWLSQGWHVILVALVGGALGMGVYFALIWLMRVEELNSLIGSVKHRILHR